jgi:hypothetical protein
MKMLVRCLMVAMAAAVLLVIAQSKHISGARTELARLNATSSVAQPTGATPATSPALSEEVNRLRAENRDIYKLRGEISLAREKRKTVERMQAENANLREQIEKIKSNPQAALAGAFSLADKGQSTPEAALETAFWSMYQGNIDALSRVMPMATIGFDKMTTEEKPNTLAMLKLMASTIRKLEILDRTDSPDETHLSVRIVAPDGVNLSSAFGGKKSFLLRRTNDIWQIVSERPE